MKHSAKKATKLTAPLCFFLYAFSGALLALPIAFPAFWLAGWIAPIPVLYLELCKKEKDSYLRAYGRGMCFFWFFGIVVFHWFTQLYPLDFLGFEKSDALITVLLATLGIPLLQSIVSSLVFVFICFIRKKGFIKAHPILSSVFTASLFSLFEFCHTLTWIGVPWGRFAVGQVGCLQIIQSVSLFGSYFITFIMIFTSSLLAVFNKKAREKQFRSSVLCLTLAMLVFFMNFTFGAVKCALPEKDAETVTVGAVQGNIRFEDKWDNKARYTMDTYSSLTKKAAGDGAELVIWPETALPYDISENDAIYEFFSETSRESGCQVLITVFESDTTGIYNTARLAKKDGTIDGTVYKKRHLVPFGEYIPMEELISAVYPPLTELSSMMEEISPGEDTAIIDTDYGRLGTLICFDSIYEELCRESVSDGAELIAISTNDSWFSKSSALSQHNAQAQLRAVENGRYVVRAANTGISSVISPKGEILTSIGDSEEGFITADVRFLDNTTLYTRTGNIFVFFCALYVAIITAAALIENKKRREKQK